jgi:cyclopropane-fatty-acyl-phospholipid synthase
MWYDSLLENDQLPDGLLRRGIRGLNRQRLQEETAPEVESQQAKLMRFIAQLKSGPVAIHTRDANQQHYEVPTAFFQSVLGPRMKYSSCVWPAGISSLAAAEEEMLALTCRRAGIQDGQQVLDLGCGWGSFSLYAAEKFPGSHFTGVSNSRSQKEFIDAAARARGLANVTIVTADINAFEPGRTFDRIVSVEMLEHVRNYETLFARIASWLQPDGRMFAHIFCHRELAYAFEADGDNDWMARHFFTGGIMPSAGLFHYFQRDLTLVDQWAVNGTHYEKTCNAWLANMDASRAAILPVFEATYGADQAVKWWSYWRIFFMACAELFGHRDGNEWFVAHYLFQPARG